MVGLARTGTAVSRWLADQGVRVYASDADDRPAVAAAGDALRKRGIAVDIGGHDLGRIARAATVVVSPGVPPAAPPLQAARDAGVPVRAELDVAATALPATRLIVVTGTNGKSTTTALIAHILTQAGRHVEAVGNIGRPLIELAAEVTPPTWAVVEASSFQLHDAPGLRPAVGVLTNLSPDHLDRYPSVDAYYADKQLLFRNADAESQWMLNGDDGAVGALSANVAGVRRFWRLESKADAWFDRAAGLLMLGPHALVDRASFGLLGDHNVENALAAALVAAVVGIDAHDIGAGLRSFPGLRHRLEFVREVRGVRWFNDSKATNVSSASVAVRAIPGPYVLLMGGRHKGQPYDHLGDVLGSGCRHIFAFGEAAAEIDRDLSGRCPLARVETLGEAIRAAATAAQPGDVVLLSPACSSFDQFGSFEERGDAFRDAVAAL